jgi:c(7)-type cytochrome triheme protein
MFKRLIVIVNLLLICFTTSLVMAADKAGILYTQPLESVIFSHQDHIQKGASCNTCHSGLFEMEALHAQKNKDFTMDSLYKGKYCGACHNGKKAFASDTQCARCHLGSGVPTPPKDAPVYKTSITLGKGDQGVAFHHDAHLKIKKATCGSCHSALFKPQEGASKIKMADHSQNKYCFTCHDQKGKGTFAWSDCSRCHQKSIPSPKGTIPFGKGDKAVAFKHESHQLKAGCKVCHLQPFSFKKGTAKIDFNDHTKNQSCFTCHDQQGKAAFAWSNCRLCHKKSIPAPTETITFGKESKMGAVVFKHESHQPEAGCKACHPQTFSFKKGTVKIGFGDHTSGKSCFTCHAKKNGIASYDCNHCHKK